MRHPLRVLALLLGLTAALAGCAATNYEQPADSAQYDTAQYDESGADYGYFYDALSPYGAWYQVEPYGWVWTPYDVPAGWRPYTDGQWISTAYGWTWLSDDPWGWAVYHYGRWTWDSYYGWLWVPGDVWAPAWVAWRYGEGWVGWAPLPPQIGWDGYGLDYGSYTIEDISRYRWSFCDEKDFTQTRIRTFVVPRSRNVTLLKTTKDVTRYGSVNARPVEQGLTSDMIERDLKTKIKRYEVTDAPGVGRDRAAVVRGHVVEMYRPRIQAGSPDKDRTPPNATNRPGEKQRLDDRQKARAERQRNATTDESQKERSQIQPPGRRMDQPNVQAPATGFKSTPESNASSGTKSKPASGAESKPASSQGAQSQDEAKPRAETESQNAQWQAEAQREAEAQRQAAEQRDLEARTRAQREQLKKEQQKDIKNPPPGVSREELKERHQEEQQSQQEVEKRDREELKNREELRKQWEQAHEQARQQQEKEKQRKQQQDDNRGQQKKPFDSGQSKDQQQDQGQTRQR